MPTESYYLKKAATAKGVSVEEAKDDIKTRAEILSFLVNQGKRTFSEVTLAIRDYMSTLKTSESSRRSGDQ
jgi:DNA-binding transcriptional ArsR family regulator